MKKIKKIWNKWQGISKKIVTFQSKILLTLVYFIFISPMAIVLKRFSDPLSLQGKPRWLKKNTTKQTRDQLINQ